MVRTIALRAREGQSADQAMRINAEHIVMLEPVLSRTPTAMILHVRLKLASAPLMDVRLGEFPDVDALDSEWQTFLEAVQRLVRLVALPARDGPKGAAAMWISPHRVGALQPVFSTTGAASILRAQLKLEGMELMDVWLGEFVDDEEATAGWRSFVAEIDGDQKPPV